MYARREWHALKKSGGAWKVGRFLAFITVSHPGQGYMFPARAAETVKPIIDAGSAEKLWEDDDSLHRHSTIYVQAPGTPPAGHYAISVYIVPVPDRLPAFQITGSLYLAASRQWDGMLDEPSWPDGYAVTFHVDDRRWITSNYTDSDLLARQRGARRSRTWGDGRGFGVRAKVTADLTAEALLQWRRQACCAYDRFIVLAGVAYPYGVDRADPDNSAETVNAILQAGITAGAWQDVTMRHCKGVAFFRLPNLKRRGVHEVRLMVLPVPEGFQLSGTIADMAEHAWAEHDRRCA